jgi:hypothetical protein
VSPVKYELGFYIPEDDILLIENHTMRPALFTCFLLSGSRFLHCHEWTVLTPYVGTHSLYTE